MQPAQTARPIVYVVDDDSRIREAVGELLACAGLRAVPLSSAEEYLRYPREATPSCLLLDIELPDLSGLALQERIRNESPPIVFLTGNGDIPSSVRAMRAGAVDFLTKPCAGEDLLKAVHVALERDRVARTERAQLQQLRDKHASLTPREQEVLPLVASGLLNKESAAGLGISEITLQIHRRNIMRKLRASSFAELVRLADRLAVAPPAP